MLLFLCNKSWMFPILMLAGATIEGVYFDSISHLLLFCSNFDLVKIASFPVYYYYYIIVLNCLNSYYIHSTLLQFSKYINAYKILTYITKQTYFSKKIIYEYSYVNLYAILSGYQF